MGLMTRVPRVNRVSRSGQVPTIDVDTVKASGYSCIDFPHFTLI
jgi:hypothetical protein